MVYQDDEDEGLQKTEIHHSSSVTSPPHPPGMVLGWKVSGTRRTSQRRGEPPHRGQDWSRDSGASFYSRLTMKTKRSWTMCNYSWVQKFVHPTENKNGVTDDDEGTTHNAVNPALVFALPWGCINFWTELRRMMVSGFMRIAAPPLGCATLFVLLCEWTITFSHAGSCPACLRAAESFGRCCVNTDICLRSEWLK